MQNLFYRQKRSARTKPNAMETKASFQAFAFYTPPLESVNDVRVIWRGSVSKGSHELHRYWIDEAGKIRVLDRVKVARSHDTTAQCVQVRIVQTRIPEETSEEADIGMNLTGACEPRVW